ncbi:hypothetical protein EGJ29_00460 [Pseudomonas sp. s199]|nr:hypothetical protein EGJ29_00460 [Pseudomonas sp. s199]
MFAQRKVSKRKRTPTSGSGLRPDFPHSGAAPGAVTKGRPCPFVPRSASCLAPPCATPPLGLSDGDMSPSRLEDREFALAFWPDAQTIRRHQPPLSGG